MLRESDQDTISAISTPLGEGGIGIIRLSGKDAVAVTDKIFRARGGKSVQAQKTHTVQLGQIVSSKDKIIDEVLVLVMRGPNSFTREDVVEISAHGGPAVVQAIFERTLEEGARSAARGEFTKRAFLNGRLDLVQAEAVLDLIQAKTPVARSWAAEQLEGVLSKRFYSLKNRLVEILTHLEAQVDFPEDFPDTDTHETLTQKMSAIAGELRELADSATVGVLVKQGLKVVIAGRPNVGKSSLMNLLSKTNRVIVTPYSGTTRDVVDQEIQIGGFLVRLADTAGIRQTDHPIEKEGIERSKLAVQEADLVIYVLDGSEPVKDEDRELLSDLDDKPRIIVLNKSDLPGKIQKALFKKDLIIETSCTQGTGIRQLEEAITSLVTKGKVSVSEETFVSSARQKTHLDKACTHAQESVSGFKEQRSPELISLEIRAILEELGMLVGEVVTDDVLEALFQRFCIGK